MFQKEQAVFRLGQLGKVKVLGFLSHMWAGFQNPEIRLTKKEVLTNHRVLIKYAGHYLILKSH